MRTMKSSLKVLGKSRLTFEEMETAVAEVEMMINSRPLTYIQDDVHEILTPSHLMLGRRLLTNYSFNVFTDKTKLASCTKRLQLIAALLKHYFRDSDVNILTNNENIILMLKEMRNEPVRYRQLEIWF